MKATDLEQRILKQSLLCTVMIAGLGIAVGILSGSLAIIFDGMFSALDAAMCSLSLLVTRLLQQESSRRFQHGFWHIEPLVLVFNGSLLAVLCFYAFINAVKGLLDGGHELEFGWGVFYAVVVAAFCLVMFLRERRVNRVIDSELIGLDIKSWLMSACISSALLLAFSIAWLLERIGQGHLTPYIDPGVLALLTVVLIPMPIGTVIGAVKEVLLITPPDLEHELRDLMQQLTADYGFVKHSHYATRVGRGLFVEVHIVLPEAMEHAGVRQLDQIRDRISRAIGESGPDRWLTVAFTRDPRWL
ncbi:cation diffusion facilitator family transporter [Paraburkholderia atlantica]|uniref:cation diffusion facilitator family transporter n=1 Tax=Paraburkholderia atlantica TaxID=2654982 RepID=UPI00161CFEF2|nr:cation transporter [Paraburkholderia atlantica]MBB5414553.1 putative Co/Zn/Cd cation transporter (cation efflux family) [Paraburkholderia atlantica]